MSRIELVKGVSITSDSVSKNNNKGFQAQNSETGPEIINQENTDIEPVLEEIPRNEVEFLEKHQLSHYMNSRTISDVGLTLDGEIDPLMIVIAIPVDVPKALNSSQFIDIMLVLIVGVTKTDLWVSITITTFIVSKARQLIA
jgi:hypothetical protein